MNVIEARFYETYYFCNLIDNIVSFPDPYIHGMNEFYGDGKIFDLVEPFSKYSAFHDFIEFIVDDVYHEEAGKVDLDKRRSLLEDFSGIPESLCHTKPKTLPIEHAFEFYDIEFLTFESYLKDEGKSFLEASEDDVNEYMFEVRMNECYQELIERTVKEIFHVLFQNRILMMGFNQIMADSLERESGFHSEVKNGKLFSKNGKLKRKSIPKWVRRAVFFRDRGRCVLCNKDLSGVLSLESQENYDHMIPLSGYGMNDISNIQLLCKECNQYEKKSGPGVTTARYESWYSYD
jgi:5-methylcytosine-specific restriction endonuclease McrA